MVSVALVSCGEDSKPPVGNDTMSDDAALELAETVVLAEVVSIDGADAGTERVAIRPLVTFAGELEVATDGTYSFERPADEPDNDDLGYWLFDASGAPLIRPYGEGQRVSSLPWTRPEQSPILMRYPASVPAAELVAAADIIIIGHVPLRTREPGDDDITIDIAEVLKGESELVGARAVVVEIGDVFVESEFDDEAFLIDETADGSLRLVDTWIAMPWSWDAPALGDALRDAFPDAAPPSTS